MASETYLFISSAKGHGGSPRRVAQLRDVSCVMSPGHLPSYSEAPRGSCMLTGVAVDLAASGAARSGLSDGWPSLAVSVPLSSFSRIL